MCRVVGGTMVRRMTLVARLVYLICEKPGSRMHSLVIHQLRFGEKGCRVDFVANIGDAKVLPKTQRMQRVLGKWDGSALWFDSGKATQELPRLLIWVRVNMMKNARSRLTCIVACSRVRRKTFGACREV